MKPTRILFDSLPYSPWARWGNGTVVFKEKEITHRFHGLTPFSMLLIDFAVCWSGVWFRIYQKLGKY